MKTYFIFTLTLFLLSSLSVAQPNIYKQVDKQGNISYTNVRSGSTEKVDLPTLVVVPHTSAGGDVDIDSVVKERREARIHQKQKEALENEIAKESYRLESIKKEYNRGIPDTLTIEDDGYDQGYIDHNQTPSLRNAVIEREQHIDNLKFQLKNIP
jgi:hypothetical protein